MTVLRNRALPLLVLLLVAASALASVPELTVKAMSLVKDYQAITLRIDACPTGECTEREAIEADLEALELDLADLEGERDALGECGECTELDAHLDDAAVLSADASEATGGWVQGQ